MNLCVESWLGLEVLSVFLRVSICMDMVFVSIGMERMSIPPCCSVLSCPHRALARMKPSHHQMGSDVGAASVLLQQLTAAAGAACPGNRLVTPATLATAFDAVIWAKASVLRTRESEKLSRATA